MRMAKSVLLVDTQTGKAGKVETDSKISRVMPSAF